MFDDLSCAQFCESRLPNSLAMIPQIFLENKAMIFNEEILELTRIIIIARNKRNRVNLQYILENPKEIPSQLIFDDLTDVNKILGMSRDFFLENESKSEFVFQLYFPSNTELNPYSKIILELSNEKTMEFKESLTKTGDEICLTIRVCRLVPLLPF